MPGQGHAVGWALAVLLLRLAAGAPVNVGAASHGLVLQPATRSERRRLDSSDQTSLLQVTHPPFLARSGGYTHREASFGTPLYEGSLDNVLLVYANSLMCDDATDETQSYPAGPWTALSSPFVLLVDRGECSFVTKVRHAQQHGAAGVVVADNVCLCGDDACNPEDDEATCAGALPAMADDGTGQDVSIPSFLVSKTDGDLWKAFFESAAHADDGQAGDTELRVTLRWFVPRPDDRVEWDLWTSPLDDKAESFVEGFKSTEYALGEHAFLVPHYRIYACASTCPTMCTNNGRYCQVDPDNDLNSGVSGAQVVAEALRRKCIWNTHAESDDGGVAGGVGQPWWEYVTRFPALCNAPDKFSDEACIKDVMKRAGVDHHKVDACIDESGGTEDDVDNTVLQAEMESSYDANVYQVPSVFVNKVKLYGCISPAAVLSAVCAGYADDTAPEACQCSSSGTTAALDACIAALDDSDAGGGGGSGGGGQRSDSGMVPWWVVLLIILGVLGLVGLAAFVLWRYRQDRMRDQVRGILAEYLPLDDADVQPRSFSMTPLSPHRADDRGTGFSDLTVSAGADLDGV